ncbi:hypothetical protein [Naasia sp. SYSU D00948]|uniref:hypothetical protein n=1 Tax=Naasia sp. SYSU D00948 TaxID=2817379 RepID=UPI001B301D2D|nr:hypothetical protein [Naasia sp. SYSU D00948]
MPESGGEPPSYRAQLLATEHWSLLASRSTTQSEVLVRINMFLTLVSAGLVSLALIGQATGFGESFRLFAVVVLAFICVVGVLTQVRVLNVGQEDLMYVLAMNRLRGAYVELDPGVAPYLMASTHDDEEGMSRTYFFLGRRSSLSQLSGSSMIFIIVVVSMLLGLLGATITLASGGPTGLAITIGTVVGLAHALVAVGIGGVQFYSFWRTYRPLSPTPEPSEAT